ncbi:MAG: hypothetical protein ACKV19_26465 [Verrucomicrobiales bacterium]
MGEVVFVDSGQSGNVPENIRSQLAGTIPVVIIADPTGEKVYGRYDHSTLKTKDFSSIFRQARRDLRDDLKNGVVVSEAKPGGSETTPPGSGSDSTPAKSSSAAKPALGYETWKSIKGSAIEAKFEGIKGDDVTLKAKDGRTIKLKRYQLSTDSQQRLKEVSS